MKKSFAKNLVALRKESGFSQKKVSEDLGVSQALLSHYEKGIRECGLEFVVKAAKYFDVSCDFLLGVSDERKVSKLEKSKKNKDTSSNNISTTVNILFALLKKINSKSLTKQVSNYLASAVYTMFRMIYSGNKSNSQEIFTVDKDLYTAVTTSYMSIAKAKCRNILLGKAIDNDEALDKNTLPELSEEILEKEFGADAASINEIINITENIR